MESGVLLHVAIWLTTKKTAFHPKVKRSLKLFIGKLRI